MNSRNSKIQHLLISQLLEEGYIKLTLPDGMIVELGTLKEGKDGQLKKNDNYCWLIAQQNNREVSLDSFNLGLKFNDENDKIIFEDSSEREKGQGVRSFSVI